MTTDVISEFEEVVPDEAEVTEAVVEAYEALPSDFKEQWQAVRHLAADELVERVQTDFADSPAERRDVLTAHIAQRLGYLFYLSRRDSLLTKPLWDLQDRDTFERLDQHDRRVVWMIAGSTQVTRPTLHPAAALAAIALWRFGDDDEHERAARLLTIRGLPDDASFLHELVRVIGRRKVDRQAGGERTFERLARLLLRANYWNTAARMAALQLVRRYDAWWFGAPEPNMRKAIDEAATTDPFEARTWLDIIADAAVAGEHRWGWAELAVKAAIRLELGEPERNTRLRVFHQRRLYDASIERLGELFRYELRDLETAPPPRLASRAGRALMREVGLAEAENPVRAMRLLELVLGTAAVEPIGTAHTRIHRVLASLDELTPPFERLLALYVRCLVLEPQAKEFVARFHADVDWEEAIGVSETDVKTFFIVADYEAPMIGRTAEFEGIRVSHIERDSATRVRYFVMRRHRPNTVNGLVQDVELPERWIASAISRSRLADMAFGFAVDGFINRVMTRDGRAEAVERYRLAGVELDSWDEIAELPITTVEAVTRQLRHRGLLWGAVSGGAAGAFAPATTGLSAFADMPVMLHQVADLVADYCWSYGIDPRREPEVPQQILAVALRGVRGADADAEKTRKVLQRLTFRKSLLVAAIAQRAVPQLLAPVFQTAIGLMSSSRTQRFTTSLTSSLKPGEDRSFVANVAEDLALPLVAGMIGAVLDLSLVYDVCESARAVLSDRFFDRKYPEWRPFFSKQV